MNNNIKDVAQAAGVSPMTVSRVFNHPELVSEDTAQKVRQAAADLNYMPNLLARGLVNGQTHTIGVFASRLENPLYSECLSGINEQAAAAGYNVLMANADTCESAMSAIEVLMSKQIDGLILLSVDFRTGNHDGINQTALNDLFLFFQQFDQLAERCYQQSFPVVSLSQTNDNNTPHCSGFVSHDYSAGAAMAVEYLVKKGHTQIGFLSHVITNIGIWGERYHGFFDAVNRLSCEVRPEWVCPSTDTVDGGAAAMRRLLECETLPTAVYCANDEIAVGALNTCHEMGIQVPEQISIIGHDGSQVSRLTWPKLTTVSIHYKEMGRECVSLLLDISKDHSFCRTAKTIRPTLVERASVADRNESFR